MSDINLHKALGIECWACGHQENLVPDPEHGDMPACYDLSACYERWRAAIGEDDPAPVDGKLHIWNGERFEEASEEDRVRLLERMTIPKEE